MKHAPTSSPDKVSLCNRAGSPGTCFVDQTGLKLTEIHCLCLPNAEIEVVYCHHHLTMNDVPHRV